MRTIAILLVLIAIAISNPFQFAADKLQFLDIGLLDIELELFSQSVSILGEAFRLIGI